MTQFKDVINLYLGCKCLIPSNGNIYELKPSHLPSNWRKTECDHKPILRPLSDAQGIEEDIAVDCFEKCKDKYRGKHVDDTTSTHVGLAYGEVIQYLLYRHFDLFGLIESGQAIDATTLDNNPYKN